MDIFSLFTLGGGLAFFLYGMTLMSKSLEKMAGGQLERLLRRMTESPLRGLLLGVGITVAIQSSSAVTVMLVGLVNSGVMELRQTIAVVMGSNIGTTLTAWILSLTGIESESFLLNLLKPEHFSPLLALAGILLILASKQPRRRDVGRVMMGFSILMYGMELMSAAVAPLGEMPAFASMLTAFENPLLGVLAGAVFTAVIQSSAASVGILQALALTGAVNYGVAIPIIMGQNIGTCATALLSAIGVSRHAKRVAVIHITFNLLGTAAGLAVLYGLGVFVPMPFLEKTTGAAGIALCHTVFNVGTTLLLLPFTRQLEDLAIRLVSTGDKPAEPVFLDPRLMRTPGVAVSECCALTGRMGDLAHESVRLVLGQLRQGEARQAAAVLENENQLDRYEDRLGSYLVEVSQHGLSVPDMRTVSRLLHVIGDFERIGDHAVNLQGSAQELADKRLHFSPAAAQELAVIQRLLEDTLSAALDCFHRVDAAAAKQVEPMEETMDRLIAEVRSRHIRRLQGGQCTIQLGFVLNDLLSNFQRIADHCSNIAVSVMETEEAELLSHAYLHKMRSQQDFDRQVEALVRRYALPAEGEGSPPEQTTHP